MERTSVVGVSAMNDEALMRHMELRHAEDLSMTFEVEPQRSERRLRAPVEWRTYHDAMHRLYPRKYEHEHLG